MDRRQIPSAGADGTRAAVITIAMHREIRAARERVAARLIGERRGVGTVLALGESVARVPLVAWLARQSGYVPGREPSWSESVTSAGHAAGRLARAGRGFRPLRSARPAPRLGAVR